YQRAVRLRHRRDVTLPEPVDRCLLGQILRADAELVLLAAGDAAQLRHVLGGLAHGDVDIGDPAVLARVVPAVGAAVRQLGAVPLGDGEGRVFGGGAAVAAAVAEPADALHSSRDEDVAFAGLDRVV